MKTIIVLVLFIGVFFIVNGVYEQKMKSLETKEKVVYKFIPRTYYEEQLREGGLGEKMHDMYNKDTPWIEKAIGSKIPPPSN